ncbi:MAG: ATP phosphoribosyltransferase regulatory subunit, partial [Chloroflexota bacterium]
EAALAFLTQWIAIQASPTQALAACRALVDEDAAANAMIDTWADVINLLTAYGIPESRVTIQPDLARTWDYYTGIVFEIQSPEGTQFAGGGRYDELTRLLSGSHDDTGDIPAVGFAFDVEALADHLPDAPDSARRLFTLIASPGQEQSAAQWATALRQRDICVAIAVGREPTAPAALVLHLDYEGHLLLGQRAYTMGEIEVLVTTLYGK